jgi:nitrate reductase NapE component
MDTRTRTTPPVRFAVTAVGLAGVLAVAVVADVVEALWATEAVFAGLLLTAAVVWLNWRQPDAMRSTLRSEAAAVAVVLATAAVFAVVAPAALGYVVWTLVWSLAGLAVLIAGRPRGLARRLAAVETRDREE